MLQPICSYLAPFWHGDNSVLFPSAADCWLQMLEVGKAAPLVLVLLGLDSLWPRAGVWDAQISLGIHRSYACRRDAREMAHLVSK